MQRRDALLRCAALPLLAAHGRVSAASATFTAAGRSAVITLAAAWDDPQGRHFVGLVSLGDTAPLRVRRAIEVPTRAHGPLVEPDGSVLAVARRPGDWLLRWSPATGRARWLWSPPDRRYTGHVVLDTARGRLVTTETDLDSGRGLVALHDARTLRRQAEWPTHGIDPHQLLHDTDGSLLIANGGVPTLPETGRVKLDRGAMDASLVRLDGRDGTLRGQWRLDDARLSIRHLARQADGSVGIALQAEHDDAQARMEAPLLALFDGRRLRTAPQARALAGYGGDIVATPTGFAVSATRAGGVAAWTNEGRWLGFTPLADAGPLAIRGGVVWAGGSAQAMQGPAFPASAASPASAPQRHAVAALRLDNHWVVVSGAAAAAS